ncbi:unnamed protein product [Notodromas monacha]|uniref:Uncharacterized protein n=1 Tax=Notodromas monacha TaxID=399045 RepID=A0A7R9BPW8_9CRUS|nr:unnamed protein product [Notodromas monacha]CAG0918407.1 unnamed protein product [Notodromas monacha]
MSATRDTLYLFALNSIPGSLGITTSPNLYKGFFKSNVFLERPVTGRVNLHHTLTSSIVEEDNPLTFSDPSLSPLRLGPYSSLSIKKCCRIGRVVEVVELIKDLAQIVKSELESWSLSAKSRPLVLEQLHPGQQVKVLFLPTCPACKRSRLPTRDNCRRAYTRPTSRSGGNQLAETDLKSDLSGPLAAALLSCSLHDSNTCRRSDDSGRKFPGHTSSVLRTVEPVAVMTYASNGLSDDTIFGKRKFLDKAPRMSSFPLFASGSGSVSYCPGQTKMASVTTYETNGTALDRFQIIRLKQGIVSKYSADAHQLCDASSFSGALSCVTLTRRDDQLVGDQLGFFPHFDHIHTRGPRNRSRCVYAAKIVAIGVTRGQQRKSRSSEEKAIRRPSSEGKLHHINAQDALPAHFRLPDVHFFSDVHLVRAHEAIAPSLCGAQLTQDICLCCEAATLDDAQTHSSVVLLSRSCSKRPLPLFVGCGPWVLGCFMLWVLAVREVYRGPAGWMLRQLGQQQHALRKRASFRLPVERGKTESFRRSANGYSFPTALARTSDSVGDVDEDHGGSEEDFYSPVWRSASSRRRSRNWRSEDPNRVGLPSVPDEWAARFLGRPYQAWEPKNVFKSAKKRSDPFSSEKRHLGSVMKDIGFHGLPWIYFPHQAHHDKKKRFLSAVTFPYRHLAEEDSDTEDFEPMTQSGEEDNEYPTDKRHIGSAIASGYVKAIGKRSDDDSDVGDYDGILPQDIADDDDVEEDDLDDDLAMSRRKRHIGSIARVGFTPLLAAFGGQPNQLHQQLLSQYRGRTASSEEDPERRRLRGRTLEDALRAMSASGPPAEDALVSEEDVLGEEDEKQKAEKVNKVLKRVLSLVQTWVKSMGKKYIASGADNNEAASSSISSNPQTEPDRARDLDEDPGLIPRTDIPIRTPSPEDTSGVANLNRARAAETKRYLVIPTRNRVVFSSFGGPVRIPRW